MCEWYGSFFIKGQYMLEIIPNWHPVFVHFTVALLSIAVLLFVVVRFLTADKLKQQCQLVAQWNLWLGAGLTVLTVIAGVLAYNSVAHDTPSHEAMTEHRNLALVTAGLFFAVAVWSWLRARSGQGANALMLVLLLVGGGLLASTAWHGGELVYRFGLGVMSLPKAEAHDHAGKAHDHAHAPAQESGQVADMAAVDDVENCELPEKETHAHESESDHHHESGSSAQASEEESAHTHDHEDGHSHEGHSH
jgi:uncharacterized membrane protein